jgi:hypothetical protein
MTFFAQEMNIIRFSAGKQPQIKISDLGQIPILQNTQLQTKIIDLVKDIYTAKKQELINEIDNLLYNHYNISKVEIQHIEKAIKDF